MRNLLDAMVHMPPARSNPFDLIVCPARQTPDAENCVTAVCQGEGERHHDGIVHPGTRRLYHRKGQVDSDQWDVAPEKHLVRGLVHSEKVGLSISVVVGAGAIGS